MKQTNKTKTNQKQKREKTKIAPWSNYVFFRFDL